jgi:DNA modification methylase
MATKKKAAKAPARKATKLSAPASWPATKTELRRTSALIPYANNARTHTKDQVAKIAASINEFGWTAPILVDESDNVIAGHGRLLAAELLQIESVPVIVARGWSDTQRRAYVIADNQLALEAGWDREMLSTELFALHALDFDLSLTGFELDDLKGLMRGADLGEDEDALPPLPTTAVTRLGDVWLLQDAAAAHRVACGDSTDAATIERLFAGARPQMMITDPPYGVEYDPQWRNKSKVSNTPAKRLGTVHNDDRADWSAAWRNFPGDVAYVWHSALRSVDVATSLSVTGFNLRAQIIWSKLHRFPTGRGNYHWAHEPCWYAVRAGAKASWIGGRKQKTIWEIESPNKTSEDSTTHSTQKPLECMGRPMRNHDAALIFDPFLGSGSTLIAAHLQDRTCFGIDLEPRYVDIAVQRWQNHNGRAATLEGDGRTFAEIAAERLEDSKA